MTQRVSNADLMTMYRVYNHRYFGGKLPRNAKVSFHPHEKMDDAIGWSFNQAWGDDKTEIWISDRLRYTTCCAMMILLHEQIHLALPKFCEHCKHFDAWKRRLFDDGALDMIW